MTSRWSLRSQVAVAFLLVALVPMLTVAIVVFRHEERVLSAQAVDDLEAVADVRSEQLRIALGMLDEPRRDWGPDSILGSGLAYGLALGESDRPNVSEIAQFQPGVVAYVADHPGVERIVVLDDAGIVVLASDRADVGQPWTAVGGTGAAGPGRIGVGFQVAAEDGALMHRAVVPVGAAGAPLGRVVIESSLAPVEAIADDRSLLADTAAVSVVHRAPDGRVHQYLPGAEGRPGRWRVPFDGRAITREALDSIGDAAVDQLGVVRGVEGGWAVAVAVDSADALAGVDDLRLILVVAGIGSIAVAIVAAWALSSRLTKPLSALTDTAAQLARGRRRLRASTRGPREIATLAETFNDMADTLEERAVTDALTGLPNRTSLEGHVGMLLAEGVQVAVLFCDLDRFKLVNDTLGHGAGDRLLVEVADRLAAVVGPDDVVSRFGGDEFVVVVQGPDAADAARRLAEAVHDALRPPIALEGRSEYVAGSIGVAVVRPGDDVGSLLGNADVAMYAAKARGRARTVVFDDGFRTEAERQRRVDGQLREGIDHGDLVVHYQPIVELDSGRLVAAEALVRWEVDGVLRMPDEFLPVASESGLIVRIGDQVLARVCADLRHLPHDLRVHVNVSALELGDTTFVARVLGHLRRAGAHPTQLCLEVTEDALFTDQAVAVDTLRHLLDLGVGVGVDDFGTGYSTLSQIRHLPIDVLKVDRSFVQALDLEAADAEVARLVVQLGNRLGFDVVAEGVETDAQRSALIRMGCPRGQGWLFGPAEPLGALVERAGGAVAASASA